MNEISVTLEAVACVPDESTKEFALKRVGAIRPVNFAVTKCPTGSTALRWVLDSAQNVNSKELQAHVDFIEKVIVDNYKYIQYIRDKFRATVSVRIYADFDETVISFSLSDTLTKLIDRFDVSII